ncbi:MAG: hypothetical protein ABR554_02085 [Pyrinomonadaceae bacterium]
MLKGEAQMIFRQCEECDFWVGRADRRCVNCGAAAPRLLTARVGETALYRIALGAYGFVLGGAIGAIKGAWGALAGALVGATLGALVYPGDRDSIVGGLILNSSSGIVGMLGGLVFVIFVQWLGFFSVPALAALAAASVGLIVFVKGRRRSRASSSLLGRERALRDRFGEIRGGARADAEPYRNAQFEIELLRWQNTVEPLVAGWDETDAEGRALRLHDLAGAGRRGLMLGWEWRRRDEESALSAERQALLSRLEAQARACEMLAAGEGERSAALKTLRSIRTRPAAISLLAKLRALDASRERSGAV